MTMSLGCWTGAMGAACAEAATTMANAKALAIDLIGMSPSRVDAPDFNTDWTRAIDPDQ